MKLSEIAVRRPITTIMVFASMMLLGFVSLNRLPLLLLPDTSQMLGIVRIEYREKRSLDAAERDVIIPVENLIAQVPGVSQIDTRFGRGRWDRIMVYFHPDADIRYRMIDIDDRLQAFADTFEDNVLNFQSFIIESSFLNNRFMEVQLKGPVNDPHFMRIDLDELGSRLSQIDGVSEADAWGLVERVVDVAIHQDRLTEFRTSLPQVVNRVRSYTNEPTVIGEIEDQGRRFFVRFDGQFDSPAEINNVMINPQANVQVRHLGQVIDKYRTEDRIFLSDGKPAVEFNMQKEAFSNPIDVSRKVHNALAELNQEMPPGYEFVVENDQAVGIIDLIVHLSYNAMLGILLSMLVLFLFIRNFRMALVICVVIPICVVASFNALYFAGLTLNVVTLVGLAVGVGSLIDNAIVVMESIFRHHENGKDATTAALRGSSEVGWAIFALTVTGVIVFVPVLFIPQETGWRREAISLTGFFQEGSLAIVMPIVISMLVALMLVPMASSKILALSTAARRTFKKSTKKSSSTVAPSGAIGFIHYNEYAQKLAAGFNRVFNMRRMRWGYLHFLKACLRHRVRFVIAIVAVCSYTWFYTMADIEPNYGTDYEDSVEIEIFVYMPEGSKQEATLKTVSQIKEKLEGQFPDEVTKITARVEEDEANIEVNLTPPDKREITAQTIKEELRPFLEGFAGAEVAFTRRRPDASSNEEVETSGRGGEIVVRGPDHARLQTLANNFSQFIMQFDGVRDAFTENETGNVEYQFRLDREASALLQIHARDVAETIQNAQRDSEFSTIQMVKGEERIDIIFSQFSEEEQLRSIVTEDEEQGLSKEDIHKLPVYSPVLSTVVNLESLGHFQPQTVMDTLRRENRERVSSVYFETVPNSNFREIEQQIQQAIKVYPMPAGYRMSLETDRRGWEQGMASLWFLGIMAIILIYMSLAALFESFLLPIVIIISIPLAVVGIVWFLLLTNTPFDPMMSGLGAIFLMGMLPNSAILMVYTAQNLRNQHGFSRNRAILTAGHHRLRPILMTVLTTVLGLAPLAITPTNINIWAEFGRDMNFNWVSFARVVIGGLISSTILTLIVVPGFYFILEDIQNAVKWLFLQGHKLLILIGLLPKPKPLPQADAHVPGLAVYNLRRYYNVHSAPIAQWQAMLNTFGMKGGQLGFVPSSAQPVRQGNEPAVVKAVDGLNFEFHSGILGLLGPNGAGKTTLLRLLAGIDQPTRGTVRVGGFDVSKQPEEARRCISYLPQMFNVYEPMTAWNYLDYLALLKGLKAKHERKAAVANALEQVNLAHGANTRVGGFSAGMKQRLGLAQLLLTSPKVLIVDEPTVSLDPKERVQFRNLLSSLGRERVVIFSTHLVEDIAHCCSEVILMHQGKARYIGKTGPFKDYAKGKVWEMYVESEEAWQEIRARYPIVSQGQTAQGIRIRVLSETRPADSQPVDNPSLEDAYLYAINKR